MPVFILFTTADPFQKQNVRLDGTDYLLSLAYNQREDRIYLSLADDEENPIVSGIKVLANYPLLFRHRYDTRIPPGELMAIDTTANGSPPKLGELGEGKRCVLTYFDRAQLAELVTTVPVFIAIRLTPLSGYPGDAIFASTLASACAGLASVGVPVRGSDVLALATGPTVTVTGFSIGTVAQPFAPVSITTSTIQIGRNQRAAFSASGIRVVSA